MADKTSGAAGFEPLHHRSEFAKTLRSGRENSNMRISIEGCRAVPQIKSQGMTDTVIWIRAIGQRFHPLPDRPGTTTVILAGAPRTQS